MASDTFTSNSPRSVTNIVKDRPSHTTVGSSAHQLWVLSPGWRPLRIRFQTVPQTSASTFPQDLANRLSTRPSHIKPHQHTEALRRFGLCCCLIYGPLWVLLIARVSHASRRAFNAFFVHGALIDGIAYFLSQWLASVVSGWRDQGDLHIARCYAFTGR